MNNYGLSLVDRECEICENIATFNQNAAANADRARMLLRRTTYWLYYDESTDSFGPSKFVGFKSMTFDHYNDWVQRAKGGHTNGFQGGATRRRNEKILHTRFAPDQALSRRLLEWGQRLLDGNIFQNINQDRWQFIKLTCQTNSRRR